MAKKKGNNYFEPCTHPQCNQRFGSEKSLLEHIEGHRKEAVMTIVPKNEHRQVLSISAHHAMLKERLDRTRVAHRGGWPRTAR